MQDQLAGIDVSPLDSLGRIKQELDTLNARLAAMEARRDSVAAAVYARVRDDYEQRRRTLEDEAAPLKETARTSYAALRELLQRSEADHEGTRLDREEIDFRYSLGEFDEADYTARLAEVDRRLGEKAEARAAADALRQRFLAVLASEQELEQPPPPPRASADAATVQLRTLDPGFHDVVPPAPPPPPSQDADTKPSRILASDATQVMRVLGRADAPNAAPPRSDQTLVMRTAKLLPQNPAAGSAPIVLALKPMLFGNGKDCDVKLVGASARHAEIRASMAGFTITDQGGGVRINGVALEQHLLRQDDAIDLGGALYLFREA